MEVQSEFVYKVADTTHTHLPFPHPTSPSPEQNPEHVYVIIYFDVTPMHACTTQFHIPTADVMVWLLLIFEGTTWEGQHML